MDCKIPIWLYYGGEIIRDSKIGACYKGVEPEIVWAPRNITKQGLVEKIYEITNWDRGEWSVKILARYAAGKGEGQYFMVVPVVDDDALIALIARTVDPNSSWNALELYVEQIKIPNSRPHVIHSSNPLRKVSTHGMSSNPVHESHVSLTHSQEDMFTIPTQPNSTEFDLSCPSISIHDLVNNANGVQSFNHSTVNNELFEDEEDNEDGHPDDNINDVEDLQNVQLSVPPTQFMSAPVHESVDWVNNVRVHQFGQESCSSSDADELYIGQKFETKDNVQHAVKMFSIKKHREFITVKSTKSVYIVKCKMAPKVRTPKEREENPEVVDGTGCLWRLRAIVPKGQTYFKVKKLQGPHTCINLTFNQDHTKFDSRLISDLIVNAVKAQLNITPNAIIEMVKRECNYHISYRKAWLAKQKAIEKAYCSSQSGSNFIAGVRLKRSKRGRPRIVRIGNGMDVRDGSSPGITCSKCGVRGHNKRRCRSNDIGSEGPSGSANKPKN